MVFVYILFILVIIFSLYQYVDNSEWEEFHAKNFKTIFEHRNKRYGAYQIRTRQPLIMTYVLIGAVLLGVVAVYTKTIVNNYEGLNSMTFSDVSDTTQFTLNNENVVETPPSQFNYQGEDGDGLPQAQDGGEKREDRPETTENSSETQPQPRPEKTKPNTPEENVYDFEKQQFEMAGGAAEREKIQKEMDKRKKEREEKEKKRQQQKQEGGQGGNIGSNAGTSGKNLAEYNVNGRKAYQNNDDYIKIPGYMCGRSITEKIVVKVKVNSNGDVYWAQSQAPEGANPCCVEQEMCYAKKSRFEYSEKPIEEGTITYYFKPQQ
jgi:hypothetical protein